MINQVLSQGEMYIIIKQSKTKCECFHSTAKSVLDKTHLNTEVQRSDLPKSFVM